MASASGSCLNPKQSKSIYTDDLKWRKNPTIRNPHNSIFTPYRRKDMEERLMKHEKKRKDKLNNREKMLQRSSSSYARSRNSRQSGQNFSYENFQGGEEEQDHDDHYRKPFYNSPDSIKMGRKRGKYRPQTADHASLRHARSLYGLAGRPRFDDNPTYNDIESCCSEKTNKLKRTLHGKKFGNYINRPLKDLGKEVRPKVGLLRTRGPNKSGIAVSKDLKEYYENKCFKDSLYIDHRTNEVPRRTGDNEIIEKLAKERKNIMKSGDLYNGMMKLKKMNLLNKNRHKVRVSNHFPAKGYTINDYHDKLTKDGYARNQLGTFFYR